jgi:hypothetical protein
MANNLVDVAGNQWQRNRKVLLQLQSQLKPELKPVVSMTKNKSTFKFGKLKQLRIRDVVQPATIVN